VPLGLRLRCGWKVVPAFAVAIVHWNSAGQHR
jgi:hypothetical protein